MNEAAFKTYFWVGVGAAIALFLNNTIAGILNPVLTPLKLNYS